jgi:hypothetical protein
MSDSLGATVRRVAKLVNQGDLLNCRDNYSTDITPVLHHAPIARHSSFTRDQFSIEPTDPFVTFWW